MAIEPYAADHDRVSAIGCESRLSSCLHDFETWGLKPLGHHGWFNLDFTFIQFFKYNQPTLY